MTISQGEFVRKISHLKQYVREQDEAQRALRIFGPDNNFDFGNRLLDQYVDLLQMVMGDENDVISWWVFETDFGVRHPFYKDGAKVATAKQLYKYLKQ